jgi:hypothetical protein
VPPPWVTVWVAGVPESVKSGVPETVNVAVVVCVSTPLIPVIVSVELPVGVVVAVVIVSVEVVPGAIEPGLNDAVAPVGNPLALKLTEPLNAFSAAALSV